MSATDDTVKNFYLTPEQSACFRKHVTAEMRRVVAHKVGVGPEWVRLIINRERKVTSKTEGVLRLLQDMTEKKLKQIQEEAKADLHQISTIND